MDEPLHTLEHAQKTAVDLAIQFGPKQRGALLIPVVLETFHAQGISIPFRLREVHSQDAP